MKDTVYIMRGLPGCGKSTYAKMMSVFLGGFVICSADDYPGYYENPEGKYLWTPKICSLAHQWCKRLFNQYIEEEKPNIIVDNTNVTKREYQYYFDLAKQNNYNVVIVKFEPKEDLKVLVERNKHGVTLEILQKMLERWEE